MSFRFFARRLARCLVVAAAVVVSVLAAGHHRLEAKAPGITHCYKGVCHRVRTLDETRKLLGVHVIGEAATEIIHIGQAVMALGGTLDYFRDTVFNYPTMAECYKVAALDGLNKLSLWAEVENEAANFIPPINTECGACPTPVPALA